MGNGSTIFFMGSYEWPAFLQTSILSSNVPVLCVCMAIGGMYGLEGCQPYDDFRHSSVPDTKWLSGTGASVIERHRHGRHLRE